MYVDEFVKMKKKEDDDDEYSPNKWILFFILFVVLLVVGAMIFYNFYSTTPIVPTPVPDILNQTCPCYNYTSVINSLISFENATITLSNQEAIKLNALGILVCNAFPFCTLSPDEQTGVFAASSILNTGPTNVTGNLISFPGTISGYPPGSASGSIFAGFTGPGINSNLALTNYFNCLSNYFGCTEFNLITVETPTTYTPGTHCHEATYQISNHVILDGLGYDNPVWLFNIQGDFVVDANVTVTVINTLNPCNVIWNLQGTALISDNVHLDGSIFANTGIQVGSGTTVTGKLVSLFGDVTTSSDTINTRNCLGYRNCTSTLLNTIPYIPSSLII
jgi:hypothetical protein